MRLRLLRRIPQRIRSASSVLILGLLMTLTTPEFGVSGEIAYYSNREGEWSWFIHVINTNGSEPIKLAEGGTPAWSPDGKKIAFSFEFRGFFGDVVGIYVIDANGENRVKLTRNQNNRNLFPAWSPDGTTIAFWSNREGQPDIYVMDANGMNPTNLTRDPHDEDRPSWSPDGSENRIWSAAAPARRKKLVGHLRNGCRWRESHQPHPKPRSRESVSGVVSRWKEDCVRGIAPSQSLVPAVQHSCHECRRKPICHAHRGEAIRVRRACYMVAVRKENCVSPKEPGRQE